MESRSYKKQEAMNIPGCICETYLASSSSSRMFAALTDNCSGEHQGKEGEHAESRKTFKVLPEHGRHFVTAGV